MVGNLCCLCTDLSILNIQLSPLSTLCALLSENGTLLGKVVPDAQHTDLSSCTCPGPAHSKFILPPGLGSIGGRWVNQTQRAASVGTDCPATTKTVKRLPLPPALVSSELGWYIFPLFALPFYDISPPPSCMRHNFYFVERIEDRRRLAGAN